MDVVETLRVMIVEDESDIRDFLVSQFIESGHVALGLPSGDLVMDNLESFRPNVLLLDQRMPGKTGSEVIRELRNDPVYWDMPILMLSGMSSEAEKVASLELGADDYVTKPFSIREVIARAQALVRRAKGSRNKENHTVLSVADLEIDLTAHRVNKGGNEIPLTLTEYKILVELVRRVGQVLSRDVLREKAMGNLNVTDRTIDVHMASLRKKLGVLGDAIQTVRGVGYRMVVK